MELESMSNFFATRAEGYDEHMLNSVEGCKEGYENMARIIKKLSENFALINILDLGCGTGLELDEIFKLLPNAQVTGIDLSREMLKKLKEKHSTKKIKLVEGNYFDINFEENRFQFAISFQTLHHFSAQRKKALYKKIFKTLTLNGIYIECDYMVESQEEENFYFNENYKLRKKLNIGQDELYHYDTPMTVNNQKKLLFQAGFKKVESVFKQGDTNMIVAKKR